MEPKRTYHGFPKGPKGAIAAEHRVEKARKLLEVAIACHEDNRDADCPLCRALRHVNLRAV